MLHQRTPHARERLEPTRALRRLSPGAAALAGQIRRSRLTAFTLGVSIAGIDLVVFSLLAWFGAYGVAKAPLFEPLSAACVAFAAAALCVFLLAQSGAYRLVNLTALRRQALRIGLCAPLPLALALATAPHPEAPPATLFALAFALCLVPLALRGCALVPAVRWAVDGGLTERRAVLVGGGPSAHDLIAGLKARPDNDIRICAIFDDRSGARSPDLVLDVPRIGRFDDLLDFARCAAVDMVIIALPQEAAMPIARLLDRFAVLPLPVHLAAFSRDYSFDPTLPSPGDGHLRLLEPGSFGLRRRVMKRAFDVSFAALALLLLAPVMLLLALAVRLDSPGPVFFRQLRDGFNERPIRVLKFRTMRTERCDPDGQAIVTREDPRVTRLGAILRRSSLDELPQLFNVLCGDLSLVGPRPHALDAVTSQRQAFAALVANYSARHRLPPGITGWAQIHGWRGGIEDPDALKQRVAHDLWYIENWSVWLDLRILLATPRSLFGARNAY